MQMLSHSVGNEELTSAMNSSADGDPISSAQSVTVGVYLYIAGILAVIANASVLGAFARFRTLLSNPYRLYILHLCISDLGMAIFGGFLLSGTSSLAKRWVFGEKGCQWYAFAGFFFGIANLALISLMTVARSTARSSLLHFTITKPKIKWSIYFAWGWALFWSLCPLLGWSSYDFEPSQTTCTINWNENDYKYISYIISLTSLVFVIPMCVMAVCILTSFRNIKKLKAVDTWLKPLTLLNNSREVKMCLALLTTTVLCWSGYAVLCIWVVFLPPTSVPTVVALLPPLLAKLSIFINPLVVIAYDDNLRQGCLSCLLCKESPQALLSSPETTRMTSSSNEN